MHAGIQERRPTRSTREGAGFFAWQVTVDRPTKGSIEAEIGNAVARFHREQQGRGPVELRAFVLGDLVLVRSTGIFTPTEARLAASDEGRKLIASARRELRTITHQEIEAEVARITGCKVRTSFYDLAVEAAEQVEVYVLEEDLERRLLRQDLDSLGRIAPKRSS